MKYPHQDRVNGRRHCDHLRQHVNDDATVNSIKVGKSDHPLNWPVCYTGEPRPKGYRTVTLKTRYPSTALLRAIAELGFPPGAIIGGLYWDRDNQLPGTLNDRRRFGANHAGSASPEEHNDENQMTTGVADMPCDPSHAFVAAAPSRRTLQAPTAHKHPDGYPLAWGKKNLSSVLSRAAANFVQIAEYEVVFNERDPKDVADEINTAAGGKVITVEAVKSAAKRTRKRLLREYAKNSNAVNTPDPDLHEMGRVEEKEEETVTA